MGMWENKCFYSMRERLRLLQMVALCAAVMLFYAEPMCGQVGVTENSVPSTDTLRLSLDSAVSLALECNLSLHASSQGVMGAKYGTRAKWGALLPSVSTTAAYNRYLKKPVIFLPEGSPMGDKLEIGSDNSVNATIQVGLPLFAMPLYRSIQLAKSDQKISEQTYKGARVQVVGQVKLAYISVLLAQASLSVVDSSVLMAEKTLEDVQRMCAQGMVAEYDMLKAQVQVSNLRPMQVKSQQDLKAAQEHLRTLLALPAGQPFTMRDSLENLVSLFSQMPDGAVDLGGNNDLRMMDLQREKLHRQYQLSRDSYWPTLSAFMQYAWQTQADKLTFDKERWINTMTLGLQFSFPIFNGLTKFWQTQQLKVGVHQLEMQREYTTELLQTQLLVTRQAMRSAHENMVSSQQACDLASRAVQISRVRYASGAGTILELNDAILSRTQAALSLAQAQYAYVKAYVDFLQLLGQETK